MMYRIEKDENEILPIKAATFSELDFSERGNLQEWIAANPKVLGEELLIIQKEFSGFDNSNDRLDLLALDKSGNLVVIENKLDDSGKDVAGQGLRYVSFCSTLTPSHIVQIFAQYKHTSEREAKNEIANFLNSSDFEELELNENQRLILVAREFRVETTSTVLWLINNQLDIKCIKSVPYTDGQECFVQFNQIIPVPELSEYMVKMGNVKKEQRQRNLTNSKNRELKEKFWKEVIDRLQSLGFNHFDNTEVLSNWEVSQKLGKGKFQMALGNGSMRVQLYINSDLKKVHFDALRNLEAEIPEEFLSRLKWERRDNAPTSRVYLEVNAQELYDRFEAENERKPESWRSGKDWGFRQDWFCSSIIEFHSHFYELWLRVLESHS